MNGEIWKAAGKVYGNTEDERFNEQRRQEIERMGLKTRAQTLENLHIELVINQIFAHINWARPRYFVILAIDGVAPDAKINQQRQRRYRAAAESRFKGYFNSNSISPGTRFMMELDKAIIERLGGEAGGEEGRRPSAFREGNWLPPVIIYSSHMSPGEGEHKILDFLRNPDLKLVTPATNKGGNIFYGLDADLVLLSLISPIRNIFLYREQEGRRGTQMIRIELLKQKLRERHRKTSKTVLTDFVLMSFLVGNDFLPHQPSLATIARGMDTLIDIYARLNISLTTSKGFIHWKNFSAFIRLLAKREPKLLVNEYGMRKLFPSPLLNASVRVDPTSGANVIDMSDFRHYWYYNMSIGNPNDLEYLKTLGIELELPYSQAKLSSLCFEYLKTLSWNLQYYLKGFGKINARWFYPHQHTPLLMDVAQILSKQLSAPDSGDYIDRLNGEVLNTPSFKTNPLNVVHQLLAIMPPSSVDLVPVEVRPLMMPNSILGDMYPIRFVVERYDVSEDWMGDILIPFFNAGRISRAVDETATFTAKAVEKYTSVPALRFVYKDIAIAPKEQLPKKTKKVPRTKQGLLPRIQRVVLWKQNKLPL